MMKDELEYLRAENAILRQALNVAVLILEQGALEGDHHNDAIIAWIRTLVPRKPTPFGDALWARYGDILDKRDRSIVAAHCKHPAEARYPFEWQGEQFGICMLCLTVFQAQHSESPKQEQTP